MCKGVRAERDCSGGTCFSRPHFNVRPCLAFQRARQACPSGASAGASCLSGVYSRIGSSSSPIAHRGHSPVSGW